MRQSRDFAAVFKDNVKDTMAMDIPLEIGMFIYLYLHQEYLYSCRLCDEEMYLEGVKWWRRGAYCDDCYNLVEEMNFIYLFTSSDEDEDGDVMME